MIKEVMEYISEGFYQKQDAEVVKAFEDYETGLSLEGEEADSLKTDARRRLEFQLVKSGQMEEDAVFINPDEFFPDGVRDQDKIDDFRKTMTMHHSGQQVLWTFAGTTGAMTVLTEKQLESQGRSLDDLKPAGMLRAEKKKRAARQRKDPDTVRLYLYGDGTSSEEYNKEKAKVRFDRMKDQSGFNWNLDKYDPNYQVEKKGWFGAFNEEGEWVRVETEEKREEEGVTATAVRPDKDIKLVYTLDGPLVFDAALVLAKEEEEYYYTMDGDLYGAVKTDLEETAETLKKEMRGSSPLGVVLPIKTSEEVKNVYREKLGKEVRFYEEGSVEVETLLQTDAESRKELAGASLSLAAVTRLQRKGYSREKAVELLGRKGDEVAIPLNPFSAEDRQDLAPGMSAEASGWLDEKGRGLGAEELSHAIPFVAAALPLLAAATASSGLSETEVLDEALAVSVGKGASNAMMTGRVSLTELSEGKHPWKSSSGAEYNFFNEADLDKAVKEAGLKEGEAASLKEAVGQLNIPPMDWKAFNQRMSAALGEYRSIQMSTGMTTGDLVRSVDSISMNRPDATRIGSKQVDFEAPLRDVLAGAAVGAAPTKMISRDELFRPLELGEKSISSEASVVLEEHDAVQAENDGGFEPLTPEVALTMTNSLLAALSVASEGAEPLTEEQLVSVEGLYGKAGMKPEAVSAVMAQWKGKEFTPQEFDIVKGRLEKKLAGSAKEKPAAKKTPTSKTDPVVENIYSSLPSSSKGKGKKRSKKEMTPFIESALAGRWESVPQDLRRDLSQAIMKTSGIALPVLPAEGKTVNISASSEVITEDSRMVEAVAEVFYEDNISLEPALDQKVLLPLISQALAGDWRDVPEDIRPSLTRAVRRSGGVSSYLPSVSASSFSTPSRSVKAQNRQIPMDIPTSGFKGKGYQNLGYQVSPSRRMVSAVRKDAVGSVIGGMEFPSGGSVSAGKMSAVQSADGKKTGSEEKKKAAGKTASSQAGSGKVNSVASVTAFKAPSRLNVIPAQTVSKISSLAHSPRKGKNVVKAFMEVPQGNEWTPETLPHATGLGGPSSFGNSAPQRSFGGQQSMHGFSPNQAGRQESMSRMDRININYEADRVSIGNGLPSGERMLARSEAKSVGSAGGSGNQKKNVKTLFVSDVLDDADTRANGGA